MLTAQQGGTQCGDCGPNAHLRLQEQLANGKSAHNGTGLAGGRRDAVQGGAVLSGEQLHGGDEGGCIGAEVGEEEGQRVHHDEQPDGHRLDLLDRCCQDDQDGGHDGETCQCQADKGSKITAYTHHAT